MIMRLMGVDGHGIDIRVTGYQFPDADDPAKRFSWHVLEGRATSAEGSWRMSYPALTCDESPRLSRWLRQVAGAGNAAGLPAALGFVEPNLSLVVVRWTPASVVVSIGLDLEFAPPWQPRHAAGEPYRISCEVSREHILRSAVGWDAEIAAYPDH